MRQLPLADKGYMTNSIADFILRHPQLTDPMEAYNLWALEARSRDFPWKDAESIAFCIEMFSACIKMPKDLLGELYYDEQKFLIQSV